MHYQLTIVHIAFLPVLGFLVATLGTLVGLGGGFILVPILIFMFPQASPATITTISLTMVFLNAVSATAGNVRAHRIDTRTAVILAVGALPGAVAGSIAAKVISRENYEGAFGLLLILGAAYVLWRSAKVASENPTSHDPNRWIQERKGRLYIFYVNSLLAGIISPIAGFISSLFGIGGGVIHVPALTFVLKVPLKIASATSLLVLSLTSVTAIVTLVISGAAHEGWRRAGLLGFGALLGAQLGVYLGGRVNPRWILLILGAGMVLVGLRELWTGLV